jgi:hypothetical protein
MTVNKDHMPARRLRADGWTQARQKLFLKGLAKTGCVRDACRAASISSTSAYRARRDSEAFAQAWNKAQARGLKTVEQAAFDRAVNGWDEVVTKDGKEVSRRRRYSDPLLRTMLLRGDLKGDRKGMSQAELELHAEEAAKAAGGRFESPRGEGAARKRLNLKLSEMSMRMAVGMVPCRHCDGRGKREAVTPEEVAEAAAIVAAKEAEVEALRKAVEGDGEPLDPM